VRLPRISIGTGGNGGVEAPPWSPGHVGHTPQHVGEAIRRARMAGIESSGVAQFYAPVPIAMQAFPHAPQNFSSASTLASLFRLEDYHRRKQAAGGKLMGPLELDAGLMLSLQPPEPPPGEVSG
jgi:hypothetical protein